MVGIGSDIPDHRDAARFRQKFDIHDRFAIFIGRIDENKGCRELFNYFLRYLNIVSGGVHLVLIGKPIIPIPQHPRIHHLGFVGDQDKFDALAAAELLIMPSYFESLSMVALEAWALGKPVLANGRCDVLKGQCIRSNGGLYYENFQEFLETLRMIDFSPSFANSLGRNGQEYFARHYSWPVIERKYLDMLERLSREPQQRPIDSGPGWFGRLFRNHPPADEVVAALPTGPSADDESTATRDRVSQLVIGRGLASLWPPRCLRDLHPAGPAAPSNAPAYRHATPGVAPGSAVHTTRLTRTPRTTASAEQPPAPTFGQQVSMPPAVHQVLATLGYGDAIGNEVLGIQRVLQRAGYESEIFVETADRRLEHLTVDYRDLLGASHPDNVLIHHFSIGSRASRIAYALPDRMVLVYHNITPPEYFIDVHPMLTQQCFLGRRELGFYASRCDLALGDSGYNRLELEVGRVSSDRCASGRAGFHSPLRPRQLHAEPVPSTTTGSTCCSSAARFRTSGSRM